MTAKETEKSFTKLNGWDNKSRVKGDFQARFCERLGLKCPCLLDRLRRKTWNNGERVKSACSFNRSCGQPTWIF
jgi:hypothetical protein